MRVVTKPQSTRRASFTTKLLMDGGEVDPILSAIEEAMGLEEGSVICYAEATVYTDRFSEGEVDYAGSVPLIVELVEDNSMHGFSERRISGDVCSDYFDPLLTIAYAVGEKWHTNLSVHEHRDLADACEEVARGI